MHSCSGLISIMVEASEVAVSVEKGCAEFEKGTNALWNHGRNASFLQLLVELPGVPSLSKYRAYLHIRYGRRPATGHLRVGRCSFSLGLSFLPIPASVPRYISRPAPSSSDGGKELTCSSLICQNMARTSNRAAQAPAMRLD